MTKEKNGYVTWAAFLTISAIVLTAVLAFNGAIWTLHAREQAQFEKRMVEQFDNVKEQLREIKERIK